MTTPIEHKIENVADRRVVVLTVRGAPPVSKPHRDSVRIIPETIILTFTSESGRIDHKLEYRLSRIEIEGARFRHDGTPGKARSRVNYYPDSSFSDAPEEWLSQLAAEYAPAGTRAGEER